jgi:hypothetical protein
MNIKKPNPESKRYESIMKHGYDVKFAYHIVRLLNEIEQILVEEDLDLERNREQLKSIRRGEWKKSEIEQFFKLKEKDLECAYHSSKLPHKPREDEIRALLVKCLDKHFNEKTLVKDILPQEIIGEIESVLEKYRYR